MGKTIHPASFPASEFEVIETALMETARGRWFLAEFARRNRTADTELLLDAIARLESSITEPEVPPELDRIRMDLMDMSETIARARQEIASVRADDGAIVPVLAALEVFDAMVSDAEQTVSDMLSAAEQVQETAWQLRQTGTDAAICDELDQLATSIHATSASQDITRQRTQRAVEVLRYMESRVNTLINVWGLDDLEVIQEVGGESAAGASSDAANDQATERNAVCEADAEPEITFAADTEVVDVEALPRVGPSVDDVVDAGTQETDIISVDATAFDDGPDVQIVDVPEAQVDELPEVQFDEDLGVQIDEGPDAQIDDVLEAQVDEGPEVQIDESPEAQVDEGPAAQVDDVPEVQLDDVPAAQVDELPEVQLDDGPGVQINEDLDAQLDEDFEVQIVDDPETQIDDVPDAQMDEGLEAQLDESPDAQMDEGPDAQIDECLEAQFDGALEVQIDEGPETQVDEGPAAQVDDVPEVQLDDGPEVQIDGSPEAQVDDVLEAQTSEELEAQLDEDFEVEIDDVLEAQLDEDFEAQLDEDFEAQISDVTDAQTEPSDHAEVSAGEVADEALPAAPASEPAAPSPALLDDDHDLFESDEPPVAPPAEAIGEDPVASEPAPEPADEHGPAEMLEPPAPAAAVAAAPAPTPAPTPAPIPAAAAVPAPTLAVATEQVAPVAGGKAEPVRSPALSSAERINRLTPEERVALFS